MIQRQLSGRQHDTAVLAAVSVAQQDVLARERTRLVRNSPVLQQPDHAWHRNPHPRRMQHRALLFLRARHALQHQHQRPPRTADVDRLIRRIQHQHGSLHRRLAKDAYPNIDLRHRTPGGMSAGVPNVSFSTQPLLPHLPRLHLKTLRFQSLFALRPFNSNSS